MNRSALLAFTQRSLPDQFVVTGIPGYLGFLLFLAGLVYAWQIHWERLGMRHRAAFLALSFLPLMVGIVDSSLQLMALYHKHILSIGEIERSLPGVADKLIILMWTSAETAVLLIVSVLLFLSKHAEPAAARDEQMSI